MRLTMKLRIRLQGRSHRSPNTLHSSEMCRLTASADSVITEVPRMIRESTHHGAYLYWAYLNSPCRFFPGNLPLPLQQLEAIDKRL